MKDVIIGEFDQQKMRLCYLIAAREHLPPNVDRPVALLTILRSRTRSEVPPKRPDHAPLPGLEGVEDLDDIDIDIDIDIDDGGDDIDEDDVV